MTPTYETLFACVYANMFVCCFVMYDINFCKVRNNVAGKDASMLEQQFEDFEQQKRRDHQAQDQSKSAKQKRDRLNPPDWSQVTKAGWNMLDSISEKVPRAFRLYIFFCSKYR